MTIEQAVRRFAVSEKTLRRRLGSGHIDGARKRAGAKGPEWLLPAASVERLGYARRGEGPDQRLHERIAELARRLEEVESLAAERGRALEAATTSGRVVAPPTPVLPRPVRPAEQTRWRRTAATTVLVLGCGLLALAAFAASRPDGEPTPSPAPDTISTYLSGHPEITRIALVGTPAPRHEGLETVPVSTKQELDETGLRFVLTNLHTPADPDLAHLLSVARGLAGDGDRQLLLLPTASPPAPTPPPPQVPPPAAPAAPAGPTATTHTVAAGESLWSIAETVAAGRGLTTTAGVASIWHEILHANTDRLPVPGNPSLIYAGNVVAIPGPP